MHKEIKYSTYNPVFPKNAFLIIAHITHKSLPQGNFQKYPFINLDSTLEEVASDIGEFSEYARKKGEMSVADTCTLVPVTFHSLFPLRKEYWSDPTQHYDAQDRIKLLISAISHFAMYKLLVTPYIENNIRSVAAAIPFFLSEGNKLIEKFMLTSDWPVDEQAKNAAFYLFDKPKSFNLKTKEIADIPKPEGKTLHH